MTPNPTAWEYANYRMILRVLNYSRTEGPARAVMMVLAAMADEKGQCWPSIERLCDGSGFKKDAVHAALRQAQDLDELRVQRRCRQSNLYTLTLPDYESPNESDKRIRGLSAEDFLAEVRSNLGQ